MEVAPGKIVPPIVCLILIMSAGCTPAYKGKLYRFDGIEQCATDVNVALAPVNIDPLTATEAQLVCGLQAVRNLQPPERLPRFIESIEASRLCAILAESSPEGAAGADRRHQLGWEGVAWAEHAMATGGFSDTTTSYLFAVNMGVAVRDTIMEAMKNLNRLVMHLERAVRENPEQDQAGPLRTLGYLLIKAPAWPAGPGDSDKGLEMLKKAAALYPDYPPNVIFMARGQWEAEEDAESAMEGARKAAELLKSRNWGIRHQTWVRELRDLVRDVAGDDAASGLLEGLVPSAAQVPEAPAGETPVTE